MRLRISAFALLVPAMCLAAPEPVSVQSVKTGLFVISGGGCNSVLRLTQDGLIIVDGKLPGYYPALIKLAKKVSFSDQPVRVLVLTNYRNHHSGNNAQFLASGTQILAQENVEKQLTRGELREAKKSGAAVPYPDRYTLQLGGVEAQLLHFGNALTDGDTVVYFPNLRLVAVGDLYSTAPDPDYSAGGSLVQWGLVLGEILKLDFDTVVPGNGPVMTRADLEAFKVRVDALIAGAAALVKSGASMDRLRAQLRADELGSRMDLSGERLSLLYADLSRVN